MADARSGASQPNCYGRAADREWRDTLDAERCKRTPPAGGEKES